MRMLKLVLGLAATLGLVMAFGGAELIRGADRPPYVLADGRNDVSVHVVFGLGTAAPHEMHYVEHLAWLNAMDGGRPADRHSNAWTSELAVGYWLSGAPRDLPELIGTLAGVFDPVDLPQGFAEEERDIILREYDLRVDGNTDARADEAMDAFLYEGNAIAVSVLGTPQEIKALDYEAAQGLHAATHLPETARLVVTGEVSKRRLRRAMRDAGWPEPQDGPAEIAPPPFDLAPPNTATWRYPVPDAAARMIWRRVVALPAPVQIDLLEAQTALLGDILVTNLPGGLAGPLFFDAAIARSFDLRIRPIDEDNIEIRFIAAPETDVSLAALRDAFEAALSDSAAQGILESTHSRVLGRFEDFWPDWENADETARWMSDYVLDRVSTLRAPLSKRDLMRLHRSLSVEATNALLRQLAGEGRTAMAFIGPKDDLE